MWVPIALGRDVPAGITRAVLLDEEELVIWRAETGSVQVWEDRCPHRGMRLSFGFVRGNSLNCLYHGWQYGAGSSCQRIPAHPDLAVPPTIKAKAYPVAEAAGLIWTRTTGDEPLPELPDAAALASLAVDTTPEALLALCAAAPQGNAQIFAAELAGTTFHIGWHEPAEGRVMLHATTRSPAHPATALAALRTLRARAETAERSAPLPLVGRGRGRGAARPETSS